MLEDGFQECVTLTLAVKGKFANGRNYLCNSNIYLYKERVKKNDLVNLNIFTFFHMLYICSKINIKNELQESYRQSW